MCHTLDVSHQVASVDQGGFPAFVEEDTVAQPQHTSCLLGGVVPRLTSLSTYGFEQMLNTNFLLFAGVWFDAGSSLAIFFNYLHVLQGDDKVPVLLCNFHGGLQFPEFHSFFQRHFHLLSEGGHVLATAAINKNHFGTEPGRRTGCIHGGITTTNNCRGALQG